MASKHVVVWPKVRVFVKGESRVLDRGDFVPGGVSSVELENLTSFGAIAGVTHAAVPTVGGAPVDQGTSTPSTTKPVKPPTIKDVLAEVGDDPEKAAVALEVETDRGEDARPTLVGQLEALASPAGDGDGEGEGSGGS